MRIVTTTTVLLLGLGTMLASGCGDDDETPTPDQGVLADSSPVDTTSPGNDSGPSSDAATNTSLTNEVVPIVVAQCGFCHTRTDPPVENAVANGAYFETKEDLLGRIGTAIIAGDAANSGLIKIMKQEIGVGDNSTTMPPPASNRPAMSAADVAVVAKWIDEGALDN